MFLRSLSARFPTNTVRFPRLRAVLHQQFFKPQRYATVTDGDDVEPFFSEWSSPQVCQWLKDLKKGHDLDFEPDNVAYPGNVFQHFTTSNLKELTGNVQAGIIIFALKQDAKDAEKRLKQDAKDAEKRRYRSETKKFQLIMSTSDGIHETIEQDLQRNEWESFMKLTGGIRVSGGSSGLITSFDEIENDQRYQESGTTIKKYGRRMDNVESSLLNRVCAHEQAIGRQLLTVLSQSIDGLFQAPDARELHKWTDDSEHERFAILVRKGEEMTFQERQELQSIWESAARSAPVMEFDAVLLNSKVAFLAEVKSTLSVADLVKFDNKIKLIRQEPDNPMYRIFKGMCVRPVLAAHKFSDDENEIQREAAAKKIALMVRNGSEFGLRLKFDEDLLVAEI